MTLWQRTKDGFALCAFALGAPLFAYLLYLTDVPGVLHVGMMIGMLAYLFSFPLFGLGLILIIGETIGHYYLARKKRRTDA